VDLRPVVGGKGLVGEHVVLGLVDEGGELERRRPTPRPYVRGLKVMAARPSACP
jgi:hypothetical protein